MYGEKLYEKTILFDLKQTLCEIFGEEAGSEVFDNCCRICYDLINKAKAPNSRLEKSVKSFIAPTAAYYKALMASGLSKKHAYEYVSNAVYKRANESKSRCEYIAQGKNPYYKFCKKLRKDIKKNYHASGWAIEWTNLDMSLASFEFKTCYFYDVFKMYNCPELCRIFCQADVIEYSGLLPAVAFERSKTIADGDGCCEFKFINCENNTNNKK